MPTSQAKKRGSISPAQAALAANTKMTLPRKTRDVIYASCLTPDTGTRTQSKTADLKSTTSLRLKKVINLLKIIIIVLLKSTKCLKT